MFGGSADNMVPKKIDPRVLGVIIAVSIVGGLTIVGDRVAFVREPRNTMELVLGLPQSFLFNYFFSDRLICNVGAGAFWAILIVGLGAWIYTIVVRKVIEPMVIKNMIETKRREKELLNRFGDDTL